MVPAAAGRWWQWCSDIQVVPFHFSASLKRNGCFPAAHAISWTRHLGLYLSLRDAGVQSRFPVLRSSFSYTPFPKSSLIPETPCSQDKLSLNSKDYARTPYSLIALSFLCVNWFPNAYVCLEPSAVIMNNRRIKTVEGNSPHTDEE